MYRKHKHCLLSYTIANRISVIHVFVWVDGCVYQRNSLHTKWSNKNFTTFIKILYLTISTFHARNLNDRHYSKQKELGWLFVLWFLQLKQIIIHIFERKKTLAKFKITMVLTSTTEKKLHYAILNSLGSGDVHCNRLLTKR